MSFRALLEKWQSQPAVTKTPAQYQIRLDVDDAARVEALADLFPGIDAETVIADLLSAALNATEAAMPYEPGDEAVAQDEFGDPVYADAGLTPDYLKRVREKRSKLG
ncbi:MAG: type 1 pili tip component [Pseudomonadota bacterium]